MVDPAPREADSQPPKSSSRGAIQARDGLDSRGERGRGFEGIGEAGGGTVERHQFEGHFLRHRHHHLLELGFGLRG